jgi:hypothetical protein
VELTSGGRRALAPEHDLGDGDQRQADYSGGTDGNQFASMPEIVSHC